MMQYSDDDHELLFKFGKTKPNRTSKIFIFIISAS